MNIKSRGVLTGAFIAALSLVLVAAPANAAGSVINVGPGTLLAKGAALEVPVTFVCDVDSAYASVTVIITQKVSQGRTATGNFSTTDFTCTGESQTVTLTLNAANAAFKNGTALADVDLFTCPPDFNCQDLRILKEISLKNK